MKLWSAPSRPLFLSCAFQIDELCLSSFVPGLRSDEQGCPSIGTAWPGAVGPGFRFAAHAKPPAAALVPAKTVSRMPEIPPLAVRRYADFSDALHCFPCISDRCRSMQAVGSCPGSGARITRSGAGRILLRSCVRRLKQLFRQEFEKAMACVSRWKSASAGCRTSLTRA